MLKRKKFEWIMGIIVLIAIAFLSRSLSTMETNTEEERIIVIDAGHGGIDPGKVAVNKVLEKDINLSIAFKLQKLLEAQGITVIMTRTEDVGLYKDTDSNKKVSDLRRRCNLINDSNAMIAVSIHQNSYQSESVNGPQTFYYSKSEEGKKLAEIVQNSLLEGLGSKSKRLAKANTNYFILLNTKCPTVIAECGFLTNWKEATLLSDDAYQEKVAKAIYMGIMEYISE